MHEKCKNNLNQQTFLALDLAFKMGISNKSQKSSNESFTHLSSFSFTLVFCLSCEQVSRQLFTEIQTLHRSCRLVTRGQNKDIENIKLSPKRRPYLTLMPCKSRELENVIFIVNGLQKKSNINCLLIKG